MIKQKLSPVTSQNLSSGILLHNSDNDQFVALAAGQAIEKRVTRREQFWNKWFLLSANFLKGAIFYGSEKNNHLAVFMLHQALQHCYSGTLRVLTGYRSSSNSLKRLLMLIDNSFPNYSLTLFGNTPDTSKLTNTLLRGFSEARYSDKFNITDQELQTVFTRVEKILIYSNTTCLDHLKQMKSKKLAYVN